MIHDLTLEILIIYIFVAFPNRFNVSTKFNDLCRFFCL